MPGRSSARHGCRGASPAARFLSFTLLGTWRGALADAVPQAVRVSSPERLQSALEDGEVHIVITDHMDLSGIPPVRASKPYDKLFRPTQKTQSITVRSSSAL